MNSLIAAERLNPEKTRKFLENSFRDGEIKTVGTEINQLMPPVSRFGHGDISEKKKNLIDILKAFFDKYHGIDGSTSFIKSNAEQQSNEPSKENDHLIAAESKKPYNS